MADEPELRWHSPKKAPFHVAGFAWFETDGVYRRLPLEPAESIPETVDQLANNTAGGQIRFQTNSTRLALRVTLAAAADMDHMPATGQCAFDCYLGPPGGRRYFSTGRFDHHQTSYETPLYDLPEPEMRCVTLNFPLYMGVEEVQLGLAPGAEVAPYPPYDSDGRIIVYGTSITQGGCAARAGMCYTNIMSRRINLEFINLGFSGNGRGESELARTIATIARPALFVLDYEGNAGGIEPLRKTYPEFIHILRDAHPDVPVLAMSLFPFAKESLSADAVAARLERRDFQKRTLDDLRAAGDKHLHFLDGSDIMGPDWDECTVDGVHPTDLGFLRLADAVTHVIREILGKP